MRPAPTLDPSVKALMRKAALVLRDCADNMRPCEDYEYIEAAREMAAKLEDAARKETK